MTQKRPRLIANIPAELLPWIAQLRGEGLDGTTMIIRGLLAQRVLDTGMVAWVGQWAAAFEQDEATWEAFEEFCRGDEKRQEQCATEIMKKLVKHEQEKATEQPAKRKSGRAG